MTPLSSYGYEWSEEKYNHLPKEIKEARELLQDWYLAIEDGSVDHRLPDYTNSVITQELADKMVQYLDEEYEQELNSWGKTRTREHFEAGPEFSRMKAEQRLALAQEIYGIIKSLSAENPLYPGGYFFA